jgi:hypothetical protein
VNITPDISIGNILTIIVAIAVPSVGFIVSLIVLKTTVSLEKKRTDEKLADMDGRIVKLGAEIQGVKTGLEAGIGKVQDSLANLTHVLGEVKTKVEIRFDRDEREERAAAAAALAKPGSRPRRAGP